MVTLFKFDLSMLNVFKLILEYFNLLCQELYLPVGSWLFLICFLQLIQKHVLAFVSTLVLFVLKMRSIDRFLRRHLALIYTSVELFLS